MALKGLRVIELAGLAPGPFCGMILSDFGADVIRIEKNIDMRYLEISCQNFHHDTLTLVSIRRDLAEGQLDQLKRGKRTVCIDLKNASGKTVFNRLCSNADIIIEPFRPMVMEKLGLGPDTMMKSNKRLIYARLSGFGQNGDYANRAGHDLNYLAISGVLSLISGNGRPTAPINMLADFAGGGLTCALGILVALYERNKSGIGQVIDCSMVEGARYISTYMWHTHKPDSTIHSIVWPNEGKKEANLLDGGCPFYDVYKTKDDRWISVAALEPQFYQNFLNGLGLNSIDYEQSNVDCWPLYKAKFSEIFATKTLAEWVELFASSNNSCVEPVLEMNEVEKHDDIHTRLSFLEDHTPSPAPRLSRTPAQPNLLEPNSGEHTIEVLKEYGYTEIEIDRLFKDGAIYFALRSKL